MKSIIILLTLVLSLQLTSAQNFETTKKYEVVANLQDKGTAYLNTTFKLVNTNNELAPYSTFTIRDEEFNDEMRVTTLQNPGLDGITEVIKVEVESNSCCTAVEAYYFLVQEDRNLTPLPSIENLYCDEAGQDIHYIFPNQPLGAEGAILKTEMSYTKTYSIQNANVLQQYSWNDDDFQDEEDIASLSAY